MFGFRLRRAVRVRELHLRIRDLDRRLHRNARKGESALLLWCGRARTDWAGWELGVWLTPPEEEEEAGM